MTAEALNDSLIKFISDNPWIIAVLIVIIILKGLAMWQAAQRQEKIWFVALLIVNTVGLLEIAYLILVYFQNKKTPPVNPLAPKHFSPPKNPNL